MESSEATSLVLLAGRDVEALFSQERFLLFLHQTAAGTAAVGDEVHEGAPLDTVLLSHLIAFDGLVYTGYTTVGEAVPGAALPTAY